MNNWRLLLFALFASFQSIASFTERNLVDGRQQCCDHRINRDTRFLHKDHPSKLQSEDRRINKYREDQRDELRNENSLLARSARDTVRYAGDREGRTASASVTRSSLRRSRQMTYSLAPNANSGRDSRTQETNSVNRIQIASFTRIGTDRVVFDRRQETRENTENYRRFIEDRERYQTSNVRDNRDIRASRKANREFSRLNYQDRSLSETPRQSRLDREKSLTRDDSRRNTRTVRSADRVTRNIVRDRRQLLVDFRSDDLQRFSVTRDSRVDRARINTADQRDDRARIESRQMLNRQEQRDTNGQRGIEVNGYRTDINGHERGADRRVARDRISVSRLSLNRAEGVDRSVRNERRYLNLGIERRETTLTSRDRTNIREHSTRINERNRVGENSREDARQTSRNNNNERLISQNGQDIKTYERRQIPTDRRLENMRNERRVHSERRDDGRESRYRLSRSYDAAREKRQDRTESTLKREKARSLDAERLTRSETRRIEVGNYDIKERRTAYDERRNREKSPTERRLFSGRMASPNMRSKLVNDRFKYGKEIIKSNIYNKNEENTAIGAVWQNLMYTIQGIYLCSILLPLLDHTVTKKNMMSLSWASPSQKLIKVE